MVCFDRPTRALVSCDSRLGRLQLPYGLLMATLSFTQFFTGPLELPGQFYGRSAGESDPDRPPIFITSPDALQSRYDQQDMRDSRSYSPGDSDHPGLSRRASSSSSIDPSAYAMLSGIHLSSGANSPTFMSNDGSPSRSPTEAASDSYSPDAMAMEDSMQYHQQLDTHLQNHLHLAHVDQQRRMHPQIQSIDPKAISPQRSHSSLLHPHSHPHHLDLPQPLSPTSFAVALNTPLPPSPNPISTASMQEINPMAAGNVGLGMHISSNGDPTSSVAGSGGPFSATANYHFGMLGSQTHQDTDMSDQASLLSSNSESPAAGGQGGGYFYYTSPLATLAPSRDSTPGRKPSLPSLGHTRLGAPRSSDSSMDLTEGSSESAISPASILKLEDHV